MKKLQNVIYVTNPDCYLSLSGGNINLLINQKSIAKVPLNNLEGICTFGYQGISPALMEECLERNIGISFFNQNGRFRARITGTIDGNVVLRKTQYRWSDDDELGLSIARNFIIGKVYNTIHLLKQFRKAHPMRINQDEMDSTIRYLNGRIEEIRLVKNLDSLRGLEGQTASRYFQILDQLILQQKESFFFHGRSRRPPLDRMNALLSFTYSLLANEVTSSLEGVGLDPYVGFLHRDRPGRRSLALDVMEELRPVMADRFVLNLVNRKQIQAEDFIVKENSACLLTDEGRKKFFRLWQEQKDVIIVHPFLKEKIKWGLIPHVQSLLLARYLRDDLDEYPPFMWRG